MLFLYVVSAVVAGVLVLLSFLGADHGADHDVGVEHEIAVEHADHEGVAEAAGGHWLPFFSFRFWIYFFAGLGTTGLLLTYLAKTPEPTAGLIAAGVGLGCGLIVSLFVRALRVSEASSNARQADMLGKTAQVLVAVRGVTPGRVRLSVRGDIIDVLAVTEPGETIDPGVEVVVLDMDNGRAVVARRESILGDDPMEMKQL